MQERRYHIRITGYGEYTAYSIISQAAYEYWGSAGDLEAYVTSSGAESGDGDLPAGADFLGADEGPYNDYRVYGPEMESVVFHLDEVDGDGAFVRSVFSWQELPELVEQNRVSIETTFFDVDEYAEEHADPDGFACLVCCRTDEKGEFISGTFRVKGEELDPVKLKFHVLELPEGGTLVEEVSYDGKKILSDGGETSGSGGSVYLEVFRPPEGVSATGPSTDDSEH